jgi:hypothetical protein
MPVDSAQIALERVLAAVGQCLDRQSAESLLRLRADTEMQGRIEELADKCTEGELTPEERDEYEAMIRVGNFVAILQAKARGLLAEGHAAWWTSSSGKPSVNVPIIAANTAAFRKTQSHSSSITSNTSSLASMAEVTTTKISLSPVERRGPATTSRTIALLRFYEMEKYGESSRAPFNQSAY